MTAEARMADVIARMLDETLDSIRSSHLDQTDHLAAAAEAAATTVEEIAAVIDDEDVEAATAPPEFQRLDKDESWRSGRPSSAAPPPSRAFRAW